eukprot:jgi/Mesen1/7583/ME000392S06841
MSGRRQSPDSSSSRRRASSPPEAVDIGKVLLEARSRWLKPTEVYDILWNFVQYDFNLNQEAPQRPPSGSLYLFDRKSVRYFRKDGHNWRKKKDGRTVREAHERLKAGSVDILHCYYAHSYEDPHFQRRCYWLLEGANESIVLVHYREVQQGTGRAHHSPRSSAPGSPRSSSQPLLQPGGGGAGASLIPSTSTLSPAGGSNGWGRASFGGAMSDNSDGGNEDAAVDDFYSMDMKPAVGSSTSPADYADPHAAILLLQQQQQLPPLGGPGGTAASSGINTNNSSGSGRSRGDMGDMSMFSANSQLWPSSSSPRGTAAVAAPELGVELDEFPPLKYAQQRPHQQHEEDASRWHTLPETSLSTQHSMETHNTQSVDYYHQGQGGGMVVDQEVLPPAASTHSPPPSPQWPPHVSAAAEPYMSPLQQQQQQPQEEGEQEQLEVDVGAGGPLLVEPPRPPSPPPAAAAGPILASLDSYNSWEAYPPTKAAEAEVAMDLGAAAATDNISTPTFTISDFCPTSCTTSGGVKVLVVGTMFCEEEEGGTKGRGWGCRVGDVDVAAEVLHSGVLRFTAPAQPSPGSVSLCVTRHGQPCSQLHRFEYTSLVEQASFATTRQLAEDDNVLQVQLVQLLLQVDNAGEVVNDDGDVNAAAAMDMASGGAVNGSSSVGQWAELEALAKGGRVAPGVIQDHLLQLLLRRLLAAWLTTRRGRERGTGMGPLHLAAGLGYAWAVQPLLQHGRGAADLVNARDSIGRTPLHWAAAHGREDVVAALLASGAAPAELADPCSEYPKGCTPADLAAANGHKGMAAYLAQAQAQLQQTLQAVRNATEIATRIQNAYAAYRRQKWQYAAKAVLGRVGQQQQQQQEEEEEYEDISGLGLTQEQIRAYVAARRIQKAYRGHRRVSNVRHSAATRIQQRYRGWKGRRNYLIIRQRIVKIQAHVRGHMERSRLKRMRWSIGILEKAILRWRRKRPGLRFLDVAPPDRDPVTFEKIVPPPAAATAASPIAAARGPKSTAELQTAVAHVQALTLDEDARASYNRMVLAQAHLQNPAAGHPG